MKRIYGLILLALMMCACASTQAQEREKYLEVGLRDNQFAHFNFLGESGWLVGYEQSLMNVKIKEQTGRFFVGQNKDFAHFGYTWVTYAATNLHRNYGVFGARLTTKGMYKRVWGSFTFNPNYDSGYKYQGNYQIEGGVQLLEDEDVQLTASYGNVPEFRNNIENFRIGLKFASESKNLWVKPEVCLPEIGEGSEHIRVLVSMGWRFQL